MQVSQSQWRLFLFELKLLQGIIVAQALGQILFCRKSIGQNLCTFQSMDDIGLPFGIFQLETRSSGYENLRFVMTTFRKMRGHFLHSNIHENTDVFLPPQLQTLWLSYFLSAISAKHATVNQNRIFGLVNRGGEVHMVFA